MFGSNTEGQQFPGGSYALWNHWGVDSTTHADASVTGGAFFEVLAAQAGRRIEFWGRYINNGNVVHPEYNLTTPEVQYLARKNTRILLIYNGKTGPGAQVTTYPDGVNAANEALAAARNLGVPGGVPGGQKKVWIYCDIESGQSPGVDFFGGWFDTMRASEYGGGVYGNTGASVFSVPYCLAYAQYPSMRDANSPALLWNNQPNLPCPTQQQGFGNNPVSFNPNRPSCNPPTVIYQYETSPLTNPCTVAGTPIDLDLANGVGFESMWAPRGWQAYVIDLHNDQNNSGIVCAPSLERLPDTRLVAVMAVAHVGSSPADLGAYVSGNDGQTWAAPVELTNLPFGLPQTIVEWNGNILVFAGANPIYQAIFDTTALAWVNFGTPQSPSYWRSWYAPGGTVVFRFLRAARTFDRTQAAVTALSNGTSSPFIPVAPDGTAGAGQTIPIFGTAGPLMLRWVGASPQVAWMRPFDQLQYVSGQLYFDPSIPQYVDLYTQSGTTWSLQSTYTVDSLSKLTAPTDPNVMQVLRRGLWNVDYAWGPGTVAANGSDMYGFFSDNPIRPDAGGLSGPLSGRWRRQVGGVWTEDPVNFATDANPPLNEQNYNLHSQAMWLHDNEFRAVIEMAGPTYPGNGHYWFVSRRLG